MAGRVAVLLLGLSVWQATTPAADDLKALYDAHRWFELRDALDSRAPALYRGAVACALNRAGECEAILRSLVRSAPRSDHAADARTLLIYAYQRAGQFRRALAEIDALLALDPGNDSLKQARGLFASLGQYPDQATSRRQSTIPYRMKGGNLFVPVSIRGRSGWYIVDTGANFSVMSESEAKRLGLAVHEGAASVSDITGATSGARTAVVDELQVGATRLRHVAFLVVGDHQQPFVDLAADERGVLGIPVLLAFEAFQWTADGAFQIAVPRDRREQRRANVCFDGATPVTEASFNGRRVTLHLDTGATTTHLWPRFAADFAGVISQSGVSGTKRVTGVGNAVDVPATIVPELALRVGGFDTVLRPAYVLRDETRDAWRRDHGNLGMDLLGQARRTTIDFRVMTVRLDALFEVPIIPPLPGELNFIP